MESTIKEIVESIMDSLGPGFSEATYHNAFEVELRNRGIRYETERILPVAHDGHVIGYVRLDLVLENSCVIELKAVTKLNDSHKNQLNIYMRHGKFESGYLINFSDKGSVEIFK
jgi:GxxExxY protein